MPVPVTMEGKNHTHTLSLFEKPHRWYSSSAVVVRLRCGRGSVAVRSRHARSTVEARSRHVRGAVEVRSWCGQVTLRYARG